MFCLKDLQAIDDVGIGLEYCMKRTQTIDEEKLFQRLRKYDVISFDIFDTLVKRDVARPEDVFSLVEKMYNTDHADVVNNFLHIRKQAESSARLKAGDKEITLEEIYAEMDLPLEIRKRLMDLEEEIEYKVCVQNIPAVNVYKRLQNQGKKLFLISDMYLPEETILAILKKCEIQGYVKLFLSSSYGCRKRNGLFQQYLSEAKGFDKKVHVGDSLYSDCLSLYVWSHGVIKFIKIPKLCIRYPYITSYYKHSVDLGVLSSFIRNRLSCNDSPFFQIGYAVYGPILYSFSQWVAREIQKKNKNNILFLARDSYVIKKAYDMLNKTNERETYFYVSTRSVSATLLDGDYSCENVVNTYLKSVNISLASLLKRLNAYTQPNIQLAKTVGINMEECFTSAELLQGKIRDFLSNVICQKKKEFEGEKKAFISYLLQYVSEGDKIAVVDVGWAGTALKAMQIALEKAKVQADLTALYMGVSSPKFGDDLDLEGFFFPKNIEDEKAYQLHAVRPFLEYFLTAPHGTTLGYYEKDGCWSPLLNDLEFSDTDAGENQDMAAIREMQYGALNFVGDFSVSPLQEIVEITPENALITLLHLSIAPPNEFLSLWGNLHYFDTQLDFVAKPNSMMHYILNPKDLKRDFSAAGWKLGFLRRLFGNIPFPYYTLYCSLLRKYKVLDK